MDLIKVILVVALFVALWFSLFALRVKISRNLYGVDDADLKIEKLQSQIDSLNKILLEKDKIK